MRLKKNQTRTQFGAAKYLKIKFDRLTSFVDLDQLSYKDVESVTLIRFHFDIQRKTELHQSFKS